MGSSNPKILFALPMAYQDGRDKYSGIMRFLKERKLAWSVRLDRLSPSVSRPTVGEKDSFDGAIIDGTASTGLIKAYAATRMPLAAIDWRHPEIGCGRRHLAYIDSDNAGIGALAAQTLLQTSDFTDFAFLPLSSEPTIWSDARGAAFSKALKRKGIRAITLRPDRPLTEQLRALHKPAAVFAANDDIGAKALAACAEAGITVPEDLSVLGVDNERLTCLHTDPPLASIQPDFEQAGYMAAAALADMLARRSVKTHRTYRVRSVVPRGSMEPARSAGRLVQRALELIGDARPDFGGIDGLARQLGVSRRLLDPRFREIQHRSILEAIHEIRMERVCSLLATTNLPIGEICASCAIGTGTYPLRAFRKRFGMTMRAYRERSRGESDLRQKSTYLRRSSGSFAPDAYLSA